MMQSELGEHLVFKNEILPSLPGASIMNFMWGSTEFKWLKRVSTYSLLSILITSTTYHFHQWVGIGH